ncbi:MAG: HU family DNA-binding protein [Gemmobacter sp.]
MKLEAIADKISADAKLPKAAARQFAIDLFEGIRAAAESGEKIAVAGLGTFSMIERPAVERLAKDGTPKSVAAGRFFTFRAARATSRKVKRDKAETPAD